MPTRYPSDGLLLEAARFKELRLRDLFFDFKDFGAGGLFDWLWNDCLEPCFDRERPDSELADSIPLWLPEVDICRKVGLCPVVLWDLCGGSRLNLP